jgi:hypothetical protein
MTNERPGFVSQDRLRYKAYNPGRCVGFQQITVDGASQGLDLSLCSQQPIYCTMVLESDSMGVGARYLVIPDTDPTTTIGWPLWNGTTIDALSTEDMLKFRITEVTGTNTLTVFYYV